MYANKQINDQHNEDKVDDYYLDHDEISVEVKNDESINYSDLDINYEDEDEESDFIKARLKQIKLNWFSYGFYGWFVE